MLQYFHSIKNFFKKIYVFLGIYHKNFYQIPHWTCKNLWKCSMNMWKSENLLGRKILLKFCPKSILFKMNCKPSNTHIWSKVNVFFCCLLYLNWTLHIKQLLENFSASVQKYYVEQRECITLWYRNVS